MKIIMSYPMTPSLDGARLKIRRTAEHLDALEVELRTFGNTYADTPILNHAFDESWHVITADPLLGEPPSPYFSVICGDVVHNMRCAIDYVVWQLVLREGNRPDRWNAFPITLTREDFDARVRNPKRPPKAPLHGIGVDGLAWKLIEQHQPYHRRDLGEDPKAHELAITAKLSNIDKHRTLHIQMTFPDWSKITETIGWNAAKTEFIRLELEEAEAIEALNEHALEVLSPKSATTSEILQAATMTGDQIVAASEVARSMGDAGEDALLVLLRACYERDMDQEMYRIASYTPNGNWP